MALGEGVLAGNSSHFRFGVQDRKDVLEYPRQELRPRQEAARRQARQGNAARRSAARQGAVHRVLHQADEKASAAAASASTRRVRLGSRFRDGRRPHHHAGADRRRGNRWGVDRGVPSRLVKLDPRTGEQKSWTCRT